MRITITMMVACMALFVSISKQSEAQIGQDQWMVGASSSLTFRSTSDNSSNDHRSINLTAKFGYFFRQNLAIGVDLGMTHLEVGSTSTTEINAGPFARYYFRNLLFAGLGYSVVYVDRELDSNSSSDTGGTFSIEMGYPIWVLIERLSVEPTLRYDIGTGDLLKGRNSLSMNIGFVLYF